MTSDTEPYVEAVARAICKAGGGDPDKMIEGYVRVRGVKQIDREEGDTTAWAFWRCFQGDARAALSATPIGALRSALTLAADRLDVAASRVIGIDTEYGFRAWAEEARSALSANKEERE